MKKCRFNMWWKLTPLSALLTVLTWLGLMYIKFEEPELSLWHLVPIYIGLLLPNIYLSTFSLWHWKTRYRGRWPFAWAIAFVLWWSYLPGLMYFLGYILPDLRGKDPYSKAPEALFLPAPLPKKYRYLKSAFFVIGAFLFTMGMVWTVTIAVANWILIDACRDSIPNAVPEKVTQDAAHGLDLTFLSLGLMQTYVAIAGVCAGIGGLLLAVSQRVRWRLMDQKAMKSIQQ